MRKFVKDLGCQSEGFLDRYSDTASFIDLQSSIIAHCATYNHVACAECDRLLYKILRSPTECTPSTLPSCRESLLIYVLGQRRSRNWLL
ncbi:hypothetical protein [Gloeocapsopsis sp. IPPAS B-1203]|uniref:hypothetical protein n=1 Tax=Gloeocapsopsis sp. IPPAS B-1203 TaxID=2049454 RepID=UPI00117FB63D|nr:hypothetical protein [Gloeocapsopsis sp. IPPAS B-1203]